jgi:cytochrome P450
MKTYTFSDGVKVPARETLAVPSRAVHLDDNVYKDANVFDGFRFYKLREGEGECPAHSASCVSTSTEYLSFGHGSHAWYGNLYYAAHFSPGRFFGINLVKLVLAFILLRYDFKTKDGKRPQSTWSQGNIITDTNAELLFKKRS